MNLTRKYRQGVSTENIADYLHDVDLYLAGKDAESRFRRAMDERVAALGLVSLTPPERGYYVVEAFLDAIREGRVQAYFQDDTETVSQNLVDTLGELGYEHLVSSYWALRKAVQTGRYVDTDEYLANEFIAVFVDADQALGLALDSYAETHGLY